MGGGAGGAGGAGGGEVEDERNVKKAPTKDNKHAVNKLNLRVFEHGLKLVHPRRPPCEGIKMGRVHHQRPQPARAQHLYSKSSPKLPITAARAPY